MIKAMKRSCNIVFMRVKKIPAVSIKTCNDLKPFSIADMNFGEKILLKYGNSRLKNSFKPLVFRRFELYPDMEPDDNKANAGTHINNYINRFLSNKPVIKIENAAIKYLTQNNTPLYFNAVQYVSREIKVPVVLNGVKLDHYLTDTDNTISYLHSADKKAADAGLQIRSLDFINGLYASIFEKKDSKRELEVTEGYLLESVRNSKPSVQIQEITAGKIYNEQFIYRSKEEVKTPGYLPDLEKGRPEQAEHVRYNDRLIDRHENISGVLNIEHHQKASLKDIKEVQVTNYNSERVNLINLNLLSNYSISRFENYPNRSETGQDFKGTRSGITVKSTKESRESKKSYMTFENPIERKTFEFIKNRSGYKNPRMDMESDEKSSLDTADTGFEIYKKGENAGKSILVPLINKNIPIGVMQGGTIKESEWSNGYAGSNGTKNTGFPDSRDTLIFRKPYEKETVQPYEEAIHHETHIKEDAVNKTCTMERETQSLKEFGSEEINLLADKVFKALEKRIAIKKDKKGVW